MKRSLLNAVSTISLTLVLLVFSAPITALAGTGSISGRLIDADSGSGAGAAGVTVKACNAGGCSGTIAVSGADGSYRIDGITPGLPLSIVTFPTNACAATEFGRASRYSVTAPDGGVNSGNDLQLTRQKGVIGGFVHNSGGAAVAGVQVIADNHEQGGDGYNYASSGADGSYTIGCLPAGRGYFLTATPPSGSPYSSATDSMFTVSNGQFTGHDIVLVAGTGAISGRVTCGGQPCGSTVNLLVVKDCTSIGNAGTTSGCPLASVSTDANGFYKASNLLAGNFVVHVFAPTGWDSAARFNIAVTDGQEVTGTDVNLVMNGQPFSGSVIGHITDAAGAPYSGCRINLFNTVPPSPPTGQGFLIGATTDASGYYDTGFTLTPGSGYREYIDCPGRAEISSDFDSAGNRLSMSPGSRYVLDQVWPEAPHPWTGGHDAVGASGATSDAYFAEGYTGLNTSLSFREYITVQNPNVNSENLQVQYLLKTGSVINKNYTLAGQSRTTINVNADVGPFQEVSAHLSSAGTFVAERPMYFVYPGGIDGGHDVMAAQSLGTNFYFAEGYTGPNFSEYLTLMNPSNSDAQTNVTYFFKGGGAKTVAHTVGAHSRVTVLVNDPAEAGPTQEVSMQVQATNGVSFLAERPQYFTFTGGWTGGHVVAGTQTLGQHLNLAEGYVSAGAFTEFLTILNPNSATANVTITYYLQSGGPVTKTVSVPGNSRFTEQVNKDLPDGSANSVHLDSDQPIAAERPQYFNFQGRTGGHDAMAVDDSQLTTVSLFAEGFTNTCSTTPCFDEFYTIENSTGTDAQIHMTYFLSSGAPILKVFTVAAHTRYTRWVNDPSNPDLPNLTPNSVRIETMNGVKILAERPEYFSF